MQINTKEETKKNRNFNTKKNATLKILQTMANKTEFEKEQINKKRSEAKRLYWLNKKLSKVDSLDGHIGD